MTQDLNVHDGMEVAVLARLWEWEVDEPTER